MEKHTLAVLEFDRLLDLLAAEASSEPGSTCCQALKPDLSAQEAQHVWSLIDEAREMIELDGPPPLSDLAEVGPVLARLSVEGASLSPDDLLLVGRVIRTGRLTRRFVADRKERAPLLFDMVSLVPLLSELEASLDRSLGPHGEVLDTASAKLAQIRRENTGLRGDIQTHLKTVMRSQGLKHALRDEIITQRNERYVIPVRSSSLNVVPGLVHDLSASGATSFIEPLEVVEDNNRLNLLRAEEKREVQRILARLSAMVAAEADRIGPMVPLLAKVDSIFARAALSCRYQARAPLLLQDRGLDLRQARHPLLLSREGELSQKVVPVDLKLDPENRMLVISGVNAGGKTAALKTAGLLCLMAQAGLHLPVAEGSSLPFFDRILADIGDEQDLQLDLSTFSGHVRRLGWILNQAVDRSLVLLDELGTGTDPAEGAALALALLDGFKDRGSWVMIATHYHLIKTYAHHTDGVMNASVRTDRSGQPVFKLQYGTLGFSGGLNMALSLGLEPSLVARAESYLDEGQKKTQALIREMEEERAAMAQARQEEEYIQQELSAALASVKLTEEKLAAARKEALETIRAEGEAAMRQAEADFKQIMNSLRARDRVSGPEIKAFYESRERLRQSLPQPRRERQALPDLCIEDRVLILSLGVEGRIASLWPDLKRAEVEVDGIKVKTGLNDLARAEGRPFRGRIKELRRQKRGFTTPPQELNLIGLTTDEAIPAVDKLIDQAQLSGLKHFSIIHGKGSGRLREAIRNFIKNDRRVKDFHPGSLQFGGEGVTIIELLD
ncbi:MAG: Smr/MutS family protein [Deltaproteobacteria bacterium]|nr:Smr/MutS family protein [Deltaproteobacteria bacterium]MBW2086012.1 Smr/MutS family protein [Deltaproteobacteria bacterium]